jgi:hypothetical protein
MSAFSSPTLLRLRQLLGGSGRGFAPDSPRAAAAGPPAAAPANTPVFSPNVTAGTVTESGSPGPPMQLSRPDSFDRNAFGFGQNLNYATEPASQAIASHLGGQMNEQNMGGNYGPAGAPSEPIRSVSFPGQGTNHLGAAFEGGAPTEVDVPAAQIAFWLERGDPEWVIRERLGLAPQTVGKF